MLPIDKKPVKILFVCLGNICRSPAAQGIMESFINERGLQNDIVVDSAGTYAGHAGDMPDHRMRIHAKRRGYDLTHRSRKITTNDLDKFDLIIGMDSNNMYSLKTMASSIEEENKIIAMATFLRQHPHNDHIPDPYYEGDQGFELVLDLLEDACLSLIEKLQAK